MAQGIKKRPARDEGAEDIQKAQTVEELEKEMLGPKAPKSPKEEKQKEPKVKKPAGKLQVALLVSLLWLSLLGVFILFAIFDPTPDKIIRGSVLLLLNPEEETREEYFLPDIHALQDWERELTEFEQGLMLRETELDHWEEELDEWENELIDAEIEQELRWDEIRERGIEAIVPDLANTAKTVERMQPRNAARLLQDMDFDGALLIVSLISAKRLAPIYDVMDPDFAVELANAATEIQDPEDFLE
ncbi:MAG: hypothetical protein FWG72_05260 [Oscillospiraceae bacterium]|nr:hypothetical protein [Oscillospiraceae bacterium]